MSQSGGRILWRMLCMKTWPSYTAKAKLVVQWDGVACREFRISVTSPRWPHTCIAKSFCLSVWSALGSLVDICVISYSSDLKPWNINKVLVRHQHGYIICVSNRLPCWCALECILLCSWTWLLTSLTPKKNFSARITEHNAHKLVT